MHAVLLLLIRLAALSAHYMYVTFQRKYYTEKVVSIGADSSRQTVLNQIRLLLQEQSNQGLHCLLFHLHFFIVRPSFLTIRDRVCSIFSCAFLPYETEFVLFLAVLSYHKRQSLFYF